MRTELLLLDTEQVQSHGNREQNRGEHEQDLFLRLEDSTQEGVRPVKTTEGVTPAPPKPKHNRHSLALVLYGQLHENTTFGNERF